MKKAKKKQSTEKKLKVVKRIDIYQMLGRKAHTSIAELSRVVVEDVPQPAIDKLVSSSLKSFGELKQDVIKTRKSSVDSDPDQP